METSTPDETSLIDPLKCACSPLHVIWRPDAMESDNNYYYYDPTDEEGTEFVCKIPATRINNTYVVQEDNDCIMYCDTHLTTSVKCNGGVWTGEPELGFWCYNEPSESSAPTTTPVSTDSPTVESSTQGSDTTPTPSVEDTTPATSGRECCPDGNVRVYEYSEWRYLTWNPTVKGYVVDICPTSVLKKDDSDVWQFYTDYPENPHMKLTRHNI